MPTFSEQPYHCLPCRQRWPASQAERYEIHMAVKHPDPKWRDRAACRGMDVNVFFPIRSEGGDGKEAKAVCATCPVRTACFLESNHAFSMRSGIWGGLTANERKNKRARLGIKPATEVLEDWLFDQRAEPQALFHE